MRSREFFKRMLYNWPAKILSLVAAIIIFFFYKMSTLDERFFTAPVKVILPSGFALAEDYQKSVRITIRGEENKIYPIFESDIEPYVDLRDHRNEGIFKVPVKIKKKGSALDVGSLEVRVDPPELKFVLASVMEKRVMVKAVIRGTVAHGYEMVEFTITPQYVVIVGPRNHVEKIDEVRTSVIDITGRKEDFNISVGVLLDDSFVKVKGSQEVSFSAVISEAVILKNFKNIDVISVDVGQGLRLASSLPKGEVKIQGSQLLVENLKPDDLRLVVDCSSVEAQGRVLLPVKPETPEGIIVLDYEPKEIILLFESSSSNPPLTRDISGESDLNSAVKVENSKIERESNGNQSDQGKRE